MNENNSKRREWVKTAAIVFLSVLLVLTFFSSTIMNYSLPEVATQYVEPGTITAKIRGSGTVESNDPYEVMVKETRKVASVAVRQGDTVQQGDVLVYLEDADSAELEEARKVLKNLTKSYDQALLSADVNAGVIQGANSNTSTTTYRQRITNAQKKVDTLQKKYDELSRKLGLMPENTADKGSEQAWYNEAKAAKDSAEFVLKDKENKLTAAQNKQQNLENQIAYYETVSSGDASAAKTIKALKKQKKEADKAVLDAQSARDAAAEEAADAQLAYEMASTALEDKIASGDTTATVASLTYQKTVAEMDLTDAQKALDDLIKDINETLNLGSLYDEILEAREEVERLEKDSIGATVKAGVSGTVTTINATAGKEVSAMEPVAVIQPEGKGYTLQFSVTNEQAKRLSVGDVADLVNAWRYDDLKVTLASIRPDPQNPGQQKQLTFDVSGDTVAGQTLNVSVGQKSANYDLIVPNSAIREDNNGKFILIVETKSTPLNNRYIATRVDVEVLASDDTRSAISAALYGYEYVITTSTAPVEAGKQVRLADN